MIVGYFFNWLINKVKWMVIERRLRARKIAYNKLNHIVITNADELVYALAHAGKKDWLDIRGLVFPNGVVIDATKYGAVWIKDCVSDKATYTGRFFYTWGNNG